MVNINIKIHKRDLFLLSAIFVFLVGTGFVIAYGSGSPTTHGHDAGEIESFWVHDGTQVMEDVSVFPTGWTNFATVDLSPIIGEKRTLVLLRLRGQGVTGGNICFRPNGELYGINYGNAGTGISCGDLSIFGESAFIIVETNEQGKVDATTLNSINLKVDAFLEGYIR